jgi:hypothetical protein
MKWIVVKRDRNIVFHCQFIGRLIYQGTSEESGKSGNLNIEINFAYENVSTIILAAYLGSSITIPGKSILLANNGSVQNNYKTYIHTLHTFLQ